MITARALGAYIYLKLSGAPVSAESLSKAFPEGRKAFLTALKELRELGLITTTRQKVNGRYVTQSYISDGSPKTALLLQQTLLNTNINNITYSFISNKRVIRERMGDEHMREEYEESPMYLEPEELAERVEKFRKKRSAEYRARKESEALEFIKKKNALDPSEWSPSDSAYHFAERMSLMWHIKPWFTARTRFKAAFHQSRKTFGTTGDIELKMMDRFFESLEHNKSLNDPEIIWKMFIKQFPTLQLDVMNTTVTDEDREAAKQLADKQWGDLL